MKTVKEMLRDADPVRYEPYPLERERDRLRQRVLEARSKGSSASSMSRWRPFALAIALILISVGIITVGSRIWSQGSATLQAAVRLEVRLAEERPAAGLTEARVADSDRLIYFYEEIIVTNDDVAQSSLVAGSDPSHFGVSVEFNAAGARKMREATATHIGRPLAILIDGVVATAPVLRSPISTSALISGNFTQAEAARIVNGIGR